MDLGTSDKQRRFDYPVAVLGDRLPDGSIYKLDAVHDHELFADDDFADRNPPKARPTVPARILATVMILQVEAAFHPRVLVGARNRLRASCRPRRLFEGSTTERRSLV